MAVAELGGVRHLYEPACRIPRLHGVVRQHVEGEREGTIPGSFILWPPAEIEQSNREYEVAIYAPGFLAFGSNGGGELLAFNTAGVVYMLPAIGMSLGVAIKVSGSWAEFVSQITPGA